MPSITHIYSQPLHTPSNIHHWLLQNEHGKQYLRTLLTNTGRPPRAETSNSARLYRLYVTIIAGRCSLQFIFNNFDRSIYQFMAHIIQPACLMIFSFCQPQDQRDIVELWRHVRPTEAIGWAPHVLYIQLKIDSL